MEGLRERLRSVPGVHAGYRTVRVAAFDLRNRARYGAGAPRFAELVWIDPSTCSRRLDEAVGFRASDSGRVEDGAWPTEKLLPVMDSPRMQACVARWVDGLPWEETGYIERMEQHIRRKGSQDGCRTRQEILDRCRRLDAAFEQIRREGRLRTRQELDPSAFREQGGIMVSVGPGGELVRCSNGYHRFAMARILGLPRIPAQIGVVHRSAIPLMARLRDWVAPDDGDADAAKA